MSLMSVFDISGSAMSAQTVRLNTTASNMANANSAAASQIKSTVLASLSSPPFRRKCSTATMPTHSTSMAAME